MSRRTSVLALFCVILLLFYTISGAQLIPQSNSQYNSYGKKKTSTADSLAQTDSAKALKRDTSSLNVDDVKNIHRDFDHREQVITAGVFMGSMVFLLAAMNNFNPHPIK